MRFCQEFTNSTLSVTQHGALTNECFLDGLSQLPHVCFILVTVPLLIIWTKSHIASIDPKCWVHFPGHNLRSVQYDSFHGETNVRPIHQSSQKSRCYWDIPPGDHFPGHNLRLVEVIRLLFSPFLFGGFYTTSFV